MMRRRPQWWTILAPYFVACVRIVAACGQIELQSFAFARDIAVLPVRPPMQALRLLSIVLLSLFVTVSTAQADPLATQDKAKQIWQVLDYLAVDYGRSVKDGHVANEAEYAEMQEFAQAAERQLTELPPTPAAPELAKEAAALRASIAEKAPPETVGEQARKLASGLLAAYPVPMAPGKLPDLQQGAKLYQSQCASCHGVSGHADGPLAAKLSPPPIALADHERAQERSVFALQQIITRGVEGTSMPAFAQLSDEDRWALAYFASTLSYSDADRQAGVKLWASQPPLHAAVPTLAMLSQTSEAALAKTVGVRPPTVRWMTDRPIRRRSGMPASGGKQIARFRYWTHRFPYWLFCLAHTDSADLISAMPNVARGACVTWARCPDYPVLFPLSRRRPGKPRR